MTGLASLVLIIPSGIALLPRNNGCSRLQGVEIKRVLLWTAARHTGLDSQTRYLAFHACFSGNTYRFVKMPRLIEIPHSVLPDLVHLWREGQQPGPAHSSPADWSLCFPPFLAQAERIAHLHGSVTTCALGGLNRRLS